MIKNKIIMLPYTIASTRLEKIAQDDKAAIRVENVAIDAKSKAS